MNEGASHHINETFDTITAFQRKHLLWHAFQFWEKSSLMLKKFSSRFKDTQVWDHSSTSVLCHLQLILTLFQPNFKWRWTDSLSFRLWPAGKFPMVSDSNPGKHIRLWTFVFQKLKWLGINLETDWSLLLTHVQILRTRWQSNSGKLPTGVLSPFRTELYVLRVILILFTASVRIILSLKSLT
jgi:hypothetical protein